MRRALVFVQDRPAGVLSESAEGAFVFAYDGGYQGPPVSFTMPTSQRQYHFKTFPPFFDGLLPEGFQLEALLRTEKIDKRDYFAQLVAVGADLVGDVTVKSEK